MNVADLVAIDVHTHAETSEITGCGAISIEFQEAVDRYFGGHVQRPPAREMAAYYRERKMMAVVFTVDCTTTMGVPPVPNDEIAQAAADNPDALIAFGSVDPHPVISDVSAWVWTSMATSESMSTAGMRCSLPSHLHVALSRPSGRLSAT